MFPRVCHVGSERRVSSCDRERLKRLAHALIVDCRRFTFLLHSHLLGLVKMPTRTVNADGAPLVDKFLPHIRHIFSEVQDTIGNHQKNYTHLYKVHQEAAKHVEWVKKGKRYTVKYVGENQFEDAFFHLVVKSLALKKGVKQADNIAKFVGGYVKHANEKGERSLYFVCIVSKPFFQHLR